MQSVTVRLNVEGRAGQQEAALRNETLCAFAGALFDCGFDCDLASGAENARGEQEDQHDGQRLLPLLRQFWGPEASFRKLRFYRNPDKDNEMMEVSQGQIVDFAVEQAERAMRGDENYANLLVTAPTGAGKSLLFQLPAMYLAQQQGAVTLVIEPLKALMNDQVSSLRRRGVREVAAINSDLTFEERQAAYAQVRDGKVSLVYLSPELLLGSSIDEILNGRDLGLVVVDEVHEVTSWGKDFRPDYWYLGPYLKKLRRRGRLFPIFCLTATAVYGGRDDVVNQTIRDLELGSCKLFIGNPRRDDISFSIHVRDRNDVIGNLKEAKNELAAKWIRKTVESNQHGIVYCPYRTQVDEIIETFDGKDGRVLGYHAGKDKEYRNFVMSSFKSRSCRVLVSTKAFGMGVDIDDITAIYHYAPTGNLADYVQEIGRAARRRSLRGVASIDFFRSDVSYARNLYSLSRFYKWQLREMISKLYSIYMSKPRDQRKQKFLVSPDSFSYIFPSDDEHRRVNRVKSGLMMIAKDLEARYGFPVINIRPKTSYSSAYVCITQEAEERVIGAYGKYFEKVAERQSHYEAQPCQRTTKVTSLGSIWYLKTDKMWEDCFPDRTYADFKRALFSGEICGNDGVPAVNPRLVLRVVFREEFDSVVSRLATYMNAISQTFLALGRQSEFTEKDFRDEIKDKMPELICDAHISNEILTEFVRPIRNTWAEGPSSELKIVIKVQYEGDTQIRYRVKQSEVIPLVNYSNREIKYFRPECGNTKTLYLDTRSMSNKFDFVELLQVLGLATYDARGGDNPEIFIRLNDPTKLSEIANSKYYTNQVLDELNNRHEYSTKVMSGFFTTEMDDDERWDLIEDYFLGNDDFVAWRLGIDRHELDGNVVVSKVRYRRGQKVPTGLLAEVSREGEQFEPQPYFKIWRAIEALCELPQERADIKTLKDCVKGSQHELPCRGTEVTIRSTGDVLHPLLTWKACRVMLFKHDAADELNIAKRTDWKSYILGQGEGIAKLEADILIHRKTMEY